MILLFFYINLILNFGAKFKQNLSISTQEVDQYLGIK